MSLGAVKLGAAVEDTEYRMGRGNHRAMDFHTGHWVLDPRKETTEHI